MKAAVPNLIELVDARVTAFRPLQEEDFGFIATASGIMLGRGASYNSRCSTLTNYILSVIAMYAKTGGKNGKHSSINESSNIAAVSYICLQVFEFFIGHQFHAVTEATSTFQTKQFLTIPSFQFLSLVDTKILDSKAPSIELSPPDITRFRALQLGEREFTIALKLYRKRGKNSNEDEGDE